MPQNQCLSAATVKQNSKQLKINSCGCSHCSYCVLWKFHSHEVTHQCLAKAIRFTTVTMSCCAELLAGPSRTGYVCVLALNSECVLLTYSQPFLLCNSPALSLSDNLPLRVAVLRFAYWVLYRNFLFTFNADHERTYTHICMRALWRSHSLAFSTRIVSSALRISALTLSEYNAWRCATTLKFFHFIFSLTL